MRNYLFTTTTTHQYGKSILVTLLLSLLTSQAYGDSGVRTVVLTGDHLPGVPEDVSLASSKLFRLNNRGQVVFNGTLSGPDITRDNDGAVWLDSPGTGLEFIARNGQQAPGSLMGINFIDLDSEIPELNDAGHVQIRSFITDSTGAVRVSKQHPGTDNVGDWIWRPGLGMTRLAVGEDPTPSLNHGFSIIGPPINNLSQQVRNAQLSPALGSPTDSLWLLEPDAEPRLVAQRGGPAPSLASGVVLDALQSGVVNNSGQMYYQSRLSGPGINSTNDEVIWLHQGTSAVEIIAREGDQAPGLPPGVLYDFATGSVKVSDTGHVVLSRVLRGAGINSGNNFAWWSGAAADSLELILRVGDVAPGTSAGVVFDDLNTAGNSINAAGKITFAGVLRGNGVHSENDLGIWTHSAGAGLEIVVREGDPAGAEPDVMFDLSLPGFPFPAFGGSVSMNDLGQILFTAGMTGPGITIANDRGIWAHDRDGVLQLIVREGQQLDVDDGPDIDLRTVDLISGATQPTINNLGQVIFRATFTDGSEGIFVSNLVAVPEPSALGLAIICMFTLLGRRRFI